MNKNKGLQGQYKQTKAKQHYAGNILKDPSCNMQLLLSIIKEEKTKCYLEPLIMNVLV